jgi:hypothetical protein
MWMFKGDGIRLGIYKVEGGLFFPLFDSVLNPDYVYVTKLVGTVRRKIEPSGRKNYLL